MSDAGSTRAPAPRAVAEELPGWVDPLDALEAARGARNPVLLLSGLEGHPASRFSILACDPVMTFEVRDDRAILRDAGGREEERSVADPFDLLRSLAPTGAVAPIPPLPFAGGAVGCLGYGLRRAVERLPARPPDPLGQPDAWFGLYDSGVVFDSRERRVSLVASGTGAAPAAGGEAQARRRIADLRTILARAPATGGPRSLVGRRPPRRQAVLVTPREEYLRRIRRALDYIAAGDIYQVNLSHRIECPFEAEPIDLFRRLAELNPAPFAAYVDAGSFKVISASPERFVALVGDRAWSSPIKGTRPRGATPADDRRLARDLLESPKDRAENVMIADLVRNDLGRVSRPGSVRVASLCALESFATVHHLVSTIEGRLEAGRGRIDLLRALFPGGSMTGAPKVRAMEVIDELEGEERGLYSGSVGYLSFDGTMDFNIVIRTLVLAGGRAHLRAGGAIVADSEPTQEFRETLDKARALLQAMDADLRS